MNKRFHLIPRWFSEVIFDELPIARRCTLQARDWPCGSARRSRRPVSKLWRLLPAMALMVMASASAQADVDWRLSIKIVADTNGNIPNSTIARMNAEVTEANRVLSRHGRGIGFDLVEVLTLRGAPQWYNADPHDGNTRQAIQNAARQNPGPYFYRPNMVNVYVVGDLSGTCAFPPNDDVILMGRLPYKTLLLHECGHFFNLFHTHEGQTTTYLDGEACTDGCDSCPVITPGERDGTAETAPDHTCFDSKDDIAQNLFGVPFARLDTIRQGPINNTWANIMSYHGGVDPLTTLTADQMDRMTGESNTRRRNVATGTTWFVANDGHDNNSGLKSDSRLFTVGKALQLSQPRDVVLLRSGTFRAETLNKPVSIYASRGAVQIIAP